MKPGARAGATPLPFPGGARILQRMYTRLGCRGRPPHFVAEFYPYASLTHTIRLRQDTAYARFSDLLRSAPLEVLEAAAAILLAQLCRRQLPAELGDRYREFSLSRRTRHRLRRLRLKRARRTEYKPQGRHHNLAQLYARLNRQYFGGRLPQPRLGWSARPWRRQLGVCDPALQQIVINSRLDRGAVPRFGVEYVLYHEMLHVKHPQRRARCGLQSHSPAFRREEQRFRDYARARRFLERLEPA